MASLSEITLDTAINVSDSKLNQHMAAMSRVYFMQHLESLIRTADSQLNAHIESILAIAIDSIVKENQEVKT